MGGCRYIEVSLYRDWTVVEKLVKINPITFGLTIYQKVILFIVLNYKAINTGLSQYNKTIIERLVIIT